LNLLEKLPGNISAAMKNIAKTKVASSGHALQQSRNRAGVTGWKVPGCSTAAGRHAVVAGPAGLSTRFQLANMQISSSPAALPRLCYFASLAG